MFDAGPRRRPGPGSKGLSFGLRRADEAGFACGLETSNERNLARYRRFGFEIRGEARPFRSGPPVWSMWRPASNPILLARRPSTSRSLRRARRVSLAAARASPSGA